jgi:hypothetical protein
MPPGCAAQQDGEVPQEHPQARQCARDLQAQGEVLGWAHHDWCASCPRARCPLTAPQASSSSSSSAPLSCSSSRPRARRARLAHNERRRAKPAAQRRAVHGGASLPSDDA